MWRWHFLSWMIAKIPRISSGLNCIVDVIFIVNCHSQMIELFHTLIVTRKRKYVDRENQRRWCRGHRKDSSQQISHDASWCRSDKLLLISSAWSIWFRVLWAYICYFQNVYVFWNGVLPLLLDKGSDSWSHPLC
jgi:hypothetical protein